ncbi:MAG: hypothetical protein WAL67_07295 [Candidatus Cybelea sp.]
MRLPISATAELCGDSPKSPVTDPDRSGETQPLTDPDRGGETDPLTDPDHGGETQPLTRPARAFVKGFDEIVPSIGGKVDI